jgi:hypothetical protein
MADEVQNPKGAYQSRERVIALVVVNTLGRQHYSQLAAVLKKRVRGWSVSFSFSTATMGKKPQRGQSPRGHLALFF